MDKALTIEHIRNHTKGYPATARALKEACKDMSEFTDADKRWFSDNLPEGTYDKPEDVIRALKL